jgi:hypothetical protein
MNNRRKPFQFLWAAAFTASMGLIAFSGVASNPRFETIHILDVIRLMTAGAAVAVTIMLLVRFFSGGPRSVDNMAGENVVNSQIE